MSILASCLSAETFKLISSSESYEETMAVLNETFVFRYKLTARKQQTSESLDSYIRDLRKLSLFCNFKDVKAKDFRDEYIRDSFIGGISSNYIRSHLLESDALTLEMALAKARSLELASNDSLIFSEGLQQNISAINDKISVDETKINNFKERANEQSLDSEGDDESNQIALVNR